MTDPTPSPEEELSQVGTKNELASFKPMLEIVGLIAGPLSLVTSVLVYFGIIQTRIEAGFFGVDPAIYGYSNQDHIVRSIAPMLGPLAVGSVGLALIVRLNTVAGQQADEFVESPSLVKAARWLSRVGIGLIVAGAAWQWTLGAEHSYWAPVLLGVGGITTAAGFGTIAMAERRAALPDEPTSPASALGAGSKLALGFVIVFAAFGFAARLAQAEGFERARNVVSNLDRTPAVSVLSEDVLIINHRGVACLEVRGSRFTRRYLGLHLVTQRNGIYHLIPSGFDTNSAISIILDQSPSIRIEYDASPTLRAAIGAPVRPPFQSPDPELVC